MIYPDNRDHDGIIIESARSQSRYIQIPILSHYESVSWWNLHPAESHGNQYRHGKEGHKWPDAGDGLNDA